MLLKTCLIYSCSFFLPPEQKRVEDWKAEYMYQLLFHSKNEVAPAEWPSPIQDLVLLLSLGSESSRQLLSQEVQKRHAPQAGE